MRSLTLAAAASVNTRGAGISVTAFILELLNQSMGKLSAALYLGSTREKSISCCGRAQRNFALPRGFFLVDQAALNDCTELDLERAVVYISTDLALGLQFDILRPVYRPDHGAVDHGVRHSDLAFYARALTQHQGTRLVVGCEH